ncbi:MAG: ribosomal protein L11 methyltransferase [Ignavibacteria bacterium RBG_13_36_8]|nr:MAG: ribosomal protein L11 methyltransferase [Ignavibacteria bacterium RBG_13_36_8]
MNYRQFVVSAKPYNAELISGLLWELEIEGITEQDNYLEVYAKDKKDVTTERMSKLLQSLVDQNILETYDIKESIIENKNWNEEWGKKVNIVKVTDKIVIKPSFKEYTPLENQIIITIDPKMSFGTGEHQTTKLMLNLCEKHVQHRDKVLDIGCGTGILAITAIKLGAHSALGIDNDEWCLLNGNENITLNKVDNKVKIELADIYQISEKEFDLILANINKNVLLEIRGIVKEKLRDGGRFILSGLLQEDEEEIKKSYLPLGFKLVEKLTLDEWIALVFLLE